MPRACSTMVLPHLPDWPPHRPYNRHYLPATAPLRLHAWHSAAACAVWRNRRVLQPYQHYCLRVCNVYTACFQTRCVTGDAAKRPFRYVQQHTRLNALPHVHYDVVHRCAVYLQYETAAHELLIFLISVARRRAFSPLARRGPTCAHISLIPISSYRRWA